MKPYTLLILLGLATAAQANVTLNPLFSDGAVLQRDRPVPVWGTADPGEKVTVQFAGQSVSATADANGRWQVELTPLAASSTPSDLVATGSNTVKAGNVVVGDVWLASGQSNMASPMFSGSAAEALPTATDPLLRFFTVTKSVSAEPQPEVKGKWESSDPTTARNFSAVAYYFARDIRRTQNIPVAVINASWGGTPIKTWMSLASLEADPPSTKILDEWNTALAKHNAAKGQPELMQAYYKDMKEWEEKVDAPFREARKAYPAAVTAAKAAGQPTPPAPKPERPEPDMPDPIAMPSASKRPGVPTITYNSMIAPLQPFALKGALWYQGEADASRGLDYRALLPKLITGWRTAWNQGDFPFLIIQLPGNGTDPEPVAGQGIAFLREAQAMALKLPATGLVVTVDIGDAAEVHPDNKPFVGQRLALLAQESVYGEKIVGTSPIYRDSEIKDGKVVIRFDHAGSGLKIGEAPWRAKNAAPVPTDRLVGFYIAGEDKRWVEAEAVAEGDTVTVSSPSVPAPAAVRYGWANTPPVNLVNSEGLPAGPFRTDDWPR